MGKKLIIAEKPSVGRDIAKVLKVKQKGEGYLYSDEYIVTWAVGHLITLCEPQEYDQKYKRWSYDTLPILPQEMKIKPISQTKRQFQILKKLMKNKEVDSLICATDSGREGELIFRYIYEAAKCKKPFQRLWISSMTDQAIKKGFATLKDGGEYDNLYKSAKCRSESDWLVGMNASRAFTLQYNALLSIGRVQTPTLSLMVARQLEINQFVVTDYWEIIAGFQEFKAKWEDKKTGQTKIKKEDKANDILKKTKGKIAKVVDMETKEKKQVPPLLYDLTELQRDANKKFGFSAKKTLSIAQDLYEKKKAITYPRTDSRYVSDDMIPILKQTLQKLCVEPYKQYVQPILDKSKLPITKRIVNNSKVTDHHAIIPTNSKININRLTEDEKKVFNLVFKRFLAVFYPQYIYTQTKLSVEVEDEIFVAKGKITKQLGWMVFYQTKNKKKKDDEQNLPDVKKGDELKVESVEKLKKQTQPPKPYTEASLLSAMENAGRFVEDDQIKEQLKDGGMGTPATRAAIIERLLKVGYIERKGKQLIPTQKGMKLIEVVPSELKSPEMTGKWEKGLSKIAKGDLEYKKFMGSIQRYVIYLVGKSKERKQGVEFPQEERTNTKKRSTTFGKCPVCDKGKIQENTKAFYCNEWKAGCKFTIWKNALESYGVKITQKMIRELMKNQIVKQVAIVMPQTQEKAVADVAIKKEGNIGIELKNVNRIK